METDSWLLEYLSVMTKGMMKTVPLGGEVEGVPHGTTHTVAGTANRGSGVTMTQHVQPNLNRVISPIQTQDVTSQPDGRSSGRTGTDRIRSLLRALATSLHGVVYALQTHLEQLSDLDPEVIQLALVESLSDPDTRVRILAAYTLTCYYPETAKEKRAPQLVIQALEHVDLEIVSLGVSWSSQLRENGQLPPEAEFVLTRWLRDGEDAARFLAATVLSDSDLAGPVLVQALHDSDAGLRAHAARALSRTGRNTAEAVRALVEAYDEVGMAERMFVISSLGQIARNAPDAVPELVRMLRDEATSARGRAWIADALAEIGPGAAEAVPTLVRALGELPLVFRWAVAQALTQIGEVPDEAVPALADLAGSSSVEARGWASRALVVAGPRAAPAVPALIALLNDPHDAMRFNAAVALKNIGPAAVAAVPALIERLRQETDIDAYLAAGSALGVVGLAAMPALLKAAQTADVRMIGGLASAFAEIGRQPAPLVVRSLMGPADLGEGDGSVPLLIWQLTDSKTLVGLSAVWVLKAMGPRAAALVPELVKLLKHAKGTARRAALFALSEIGPEAGSAVPDLIEVLSDKDQLCRDLAAQALVAIGPEAIPHLRQALGAAPAADREGIAFVLSRVEHKLEQWPVGIERMGDEALRLMDPLRTFRRIGEVCRDRDTDALSFEEMEDLFGRSPGTYRNHTKKVGEFFRRYFREYEGLDIPDDDDDAEPEGCKVFQRAQAKPLRICTPLGWRAWSLTVAYLDRRDRIAGVGRKTG